MTFVDCRAVLDQEWDDAADAALRAGEDSGGDEEDFGGDFGGDGGGGGGGRDGGGGGGGFIGGDRRGKWGDDLSRVKAACEELGLRRLSATRVVHCAHSYALTLESKSKLPAGHHQQQEEEQATGAATAGVRPPVPPPGGPMIPGPAPPPGEPTPPPTTNDQWDDGSWKLVYSGDTRPCPALTAASKNATVLIHEATFENGMLEDALKKRHSMTSEAVQTGLDARAYRTILTHFSQRYPKVRWRWCKLKRRFDPWLLERRPWFQIVKEVN